MVTFALLVSIVFGILGRDTWVDRSRYGVKVFLEFMVVGLGIAWLLYWIP